MSYREIAGDLIELAKKGQFDVIGHGCNCFCRMKRGIAPQMAENFGCNGFKLESSHYEGDINKLGQIDYKYFVVTDTQTLFSEKPGDLAVVNMYTQYHWTQPGPSGVPLDYDALTLCLRKINTIFQGRHIGLPKIGCGLAGGDWGFVKSLIQDNLKDCNVTIVMK